MHPHRVLIVYATALVIRILCGSSQVVKAHKRHHDHSAEAVHERHQHLVHLIAANTNTQEIEVSHHKLRNSAAEGIDVASSGSLLASAHPHTHTQRTCSYLLGSICFFASQKEVQEKRTCGSPRVGSIQTRIRNPYPYGADFVQYSTCSD